LLAQHSQDLAALRAEAAKTRQDIAALDLLPQEKQSDAAASGAAAGLAEQTAAQDALRRQVADLLQRDAQRSQDLDTARAEAAKLRQDIAALDILHKTEEQQGAAAMADTSAAVMAEQKAAQDALRPQVAVLQQEDALRSQDLDAARSETAELRQDIAAPGMPPRTQEQQAATPAPPVATPHAAYSAAPIVPPRNGTEAAAVKDPDRMPSTTVTPPALGDLAYATASTGPPRAEAVAVTDPVRTPATAGVPPVQVGLAGAGAHGGRPQPGAEAPVEVIVVTAKLGKTWVGSDRGTGREQAAKPVAPPAITSDNRATAARPCARSGGGAECPANDRRGLAGARPMPIAINALSAVASRCLIILKRVQLGEALTDEDRTVLQTNCGPN
jgi:hypothetical protein